MQDLSYVQNLKMYVLWLPQAVTQQKNKHMRINGLSQKKPVFLNSFKGDEMSFKQQRQQQEQEKPASLTRVSSDSETERWGGERLWYMGGLTSW